MGYFIILFHYYLCYEIAADSVMIARGAQENPSAFRKEGLVSYKEGVCAYLRKVREIQMERVQYL
jgi:tRNA-dihydrouridine synthase